MLYLIVCRANADITEMRRRLRAIHLEHILKYRDRIRCGGPIMSANSERMVGMLTVLEVPDRADVLGGVYHENRTPFDDYGRAAGRVLALI
jgi:uncharacterized protein YciI